jgi:hypothetical protein
VKVKQLKLRWTAAFSLVEVTLSMALVTVLFVSLYGGIATGFGLVNLARENLRANQVIVEKMETLRLYSWDQINSNGFIPPTFTAHFFPSVITNIVETESVLRTNVQSFGNGGITYYGQLNIGDAPVSDVYATNMRLVTVTLNWTNSGIARTRELKTFVSQSGMQNYVYY